MIRRTVVLEPYEGSWPEDDPDAGFRRLVAEYSRLDPLSTLQTLSRNKNIPLGALVTFILVRCAASGSETLLEMGPLVVRQSDSFAERIGADGYAPDAARAVEASGNLVPK